MKNQLINRVWDKVPHKKRVEGGIRHAGLHGEQLPKQRPAANAKKTRDRIFNKF